jgi:hypothetical protein
MYGTMARMLKTTVYLTPDLKARLERVAAERGQSEADVIRTALEAFTIREIPRPRLPLYSAGEVAVIEDWDEALKGFGED